MNISKIQNCCGCMVCVDKCPKHCISITKDKLGHLIPIVNTVDCIDCEVCLKFCPENNKIDTHTNVKVFAAWRNDDTLRQQSSSGGLASVISEAFIKDGGVVYGCAFCIPFSFKHIRCTTLEDLNRIKGSKYVQSDTSGSYKSIAADLKENKRVLFIGTPCQVAGVRSYFRKKDNSLYTIDLICHGVPSVEMLKRSLPDSIYKESMSNVYFRHSTDFRLSITNDDKIVFERPLYKDLYLKGFFKALFYRKGCYSCQYAKKERVGDITLGDFWGVELKDVDMDKGVSLTMINSLKGEELFNQVKEQINYVQRPLDEAVAGNKQLRYPMPRSARAKMFEKLYPRIGFKWSIIFSIPEIIVKNILFHK